MWNASKTSIQKSIDNKLFKWDLEYGILDVWSSFLRYEKEGQQTRYGRKPIIRQKGIIFINGNIIDKPIFQNKST